MHSKDIAWRADLARAARDAKIRFDSAGLVSNEPHAVVMIALLRASAKIPPRCSMPNQGRRTADGIGMHVRQTLWFFTPR